MPVDHLAAPGSSAYSSNTLHVGDGTWDKTRDDFLLPNLQGLNFATMRYNGMGNRFRGLPEYHVLILGHGVLAAITFIGLVPLAIFLARFGHDWPGARLSFKLHIYINIFTVFLATIILVLGWFAVGPERSLSNPHHGIGVAIYVLILFQFLYGSCWFRRERKRERPFNRLPLTIWFHRILGRSTATLAFVQIGLGLTLYGSPKVLFILYALAGAFLVVAYLGLQYYYMPDAGAIRPGRDQPEFYSDYGSAISGSRIDGAPPRRREGIHWGRDLLAAGGAVGAYEWWKNRRDRRRDERDAMYDERTDDGRGPMGPPPVGQPPAREGRYPPPPVMAAGAIGGRRERPIDGRPVSQGGVSRESWEDEKLSDRSERPRWQDRILEATGAFAAYEGARSLFNRRRRRDDDYEGDRRYGASLGGNRNVVTETDVTRVQNGQAPESPNTPRVALGGVAPMTPSGTPSRGPRRGPLLTGDSASYDSRDAPLRPVGDDQTLREYVEEMGAIAGFREWNRQRRGRREADRAEDERQRELENEENFNRRNSNHYPRPQDANQRRPSMSGTQLTGPSGPDPNNLDQSRSNLRPDTNQPPLPAEAGAWPSGNRDVAGGQNVAVEQAYNLPPPPPGPPPNVVRSNGYGPPQPEFGSARMPEPGVYPDPARLVSDNTAANEASAYGRDPIRDDVVAAAATGAVGATAAMAARDMANRDNAAGSSSRPPQNSRNRLVKADRSRSFTSGSASQAAESNRPENTNSPPVSVKVRMHNDGRHVTLRRLNEAEAAAEHESRRQDRRRRRGSSFSSGMEDDPPPGQRYRRGGRSSGGIRSSSQQPITNVPPPPAMSSSAGASFRRDSELNLPQPPPGPPPPPQHSSPGQGISPGAPPPANEGGLDSSPMAYGTDTDVSRAADNRRRRRAERARKDAGGQSGNKVEFQ